MRRKVTKLPNRRANGSAAGQNLLTATELLRSLSVASQRGTGRSIDPLQNDQRAVEIAAEVYVHAGAHQVGAAELRLAE